MQTVLTLITIHHTQIDVQLKNRFYFQIANHKHLAINKIVISLSLKESSNSLLIEIRNTLF